MLPIPDTRVWSSRARLTPVCLRRIRAATAARSNAGSNGSRAMWVTSAGSSAPPGRDRQPAEHPLIDEPDLGPGVETEPHPGVALRRACPDRRPGTGRSCRGAPASRRRRSAAARGTCRGASARRTCVRPATMRSRRLRAGDVGRDAGAAPRPLRSCRPVRATARPRRTTSTSGSSGTVGSGSGVQCGAGVAIRPPASATTCCALSAANASRGRVLLGLLLVPARAGAEASAVDHDHRLERSWRGRVRTR